MVISSTNKPLALKASFLYLFICFFTLPPPSEAFSPVSQISALTNGKSNYWKRSMALCAKKKRRRKNSPSSPPPSNSDELPDFDDIDLNNPEKSESSAKLEASVQTSNTVTSAPPPVESSPLKRGPGLNAQLAEELGGNVEGLDEDLILSTMRGKSGSGSWQPPRSIQETLSDRSLERFMDFDAMIEADGGSSGTEIELPTMEEVIARRKQREAVTSSQEGRYEESTISIDTQGMGKKAARAAQRKAAAIQRAEAEENEKSPFEDLDFTKVLENGAWVGIGLLVLWEIYINSPFFDRAAPLIPVVYESELPPGM